MAEIGLKRSYALLNSYTAAGRRTITGESVLLLERVMHSVLNRIISWSMDGHSLSAVKMLSLLIQDFESWCRTPKCRLACHAARARSDISN
jgi:hypothetical protein